MKERVVGHVARLTFDVTASRSALAARTRFDILLMLLRDFGCRLVLEVIRSGLLFLLWFVEVIRPWHLPCPARTLAMTSRCLVGRPGTVLRSLRHRLRSHPR